MLEMAHVQRIREVCVLGNLRVQLVREDPLKYISHLDMVRMFDRAVRRAEIPIAFSTGFNPQPHIVFALPMGVGMTSECEYAQFEMASDVEPEEFILKLNNNLPKGIRVLKARYVNCKESLMTSVYFARYNIRILHKEDADTAAQKYKSLTNQETIFVDKKTKSGIKKIDIKQYIVEHRIVMMDNNTFSIEILVNAGSISNLRPELFISALENVGKINIEDYCIHRVGLYGKDKSNLYEEC
jgi:radical SAM-linked protein